MPFGKWIFCCAVFCVAIPLGVVFTVFCIVGTVATFVLWQPFRWLITENPAYGWVYIYYWFLRILAMLLGITVDVRAPPDMPQGAAVVAADHGNESSMLFQATHTAVAFPRRAKIGMKQELWWNVGLGGRAAGLCIPIPRENRQQALKKIREAVEHATRFVGFIFATSHRPTRNRIQDSRVHLSKLGYDTEKLRFTCAPRPLGVWTLIKLQRPEAFYVQMVATSAQDEGFRGIINLMYGGMIIIRYARVEPDLVSQDRFAYFLTRHWLDKVNPWVGEKRAWWWSLTHEQRRRYFFQQWRTILRG